MPTIQLWHWSRPAETVSSRGLVYSLEFRVQCLQFRAQDSGFPVSSSGFWVYSFKPRVQGLQYRVQCLGLMGQGWYRDSRKEEEPSREGVEVPQPQSPTPTPTLNPEP